MGLSTYEPVVWSSLGVPGRSPTAKLQELCQAQRSREEFQKWDGGEGLPARAEQMKRRKPQPLLLLPALLALFAR